MIVLTMFVIIGRHSRAGGFHSQILIRLIYNAYVWVLAYLYLPSLSTPYGPPAGDLDVSAVSQKDTEHEE